jgi:hypothetical protein
VDIRGREREKYIVDKERMDEGSKELEDIRGRVRKDYGDSQKKDNGCGENKSVNLLRQ